MKIKTLRQDFECWEINDQQTAELLTYLKWAEGPEWGKASPDVINDHLRAFLYNITEPTEEIPGEGFLPEDITGKNGFFETQNPVK